MPVAKLARSMVIDSLPQECSHRSPQHTQGPPSSRRLALASRLLGLRAFAARGGHVLARPGALRRRLLLLRLALRRAGLIHRRRGDAFRRVLAPPALELALLDMVVLALALIAPSLAWHDAPPRMMRASHVLDQASKLRSRSTRSPIRPMTTSRSRSGPARSGRSSRKRASVAG